MMAFAQLLEHRPDEDEFEPVRATRRLPSQHTGWSGKRRLSHSSSKKRKTGTIRKTQGKGLAAEEKRISQKLIWPMPEHTKQKMCLQDTCTALNFEDVASNSENDAGKADESQEDDSEYSDARGDDDGQEEEVDADSAPQKKKLKEQGGLKRRWKRIRNAFVDSDSDNSEEESMPRNSVGRKHDSSDEGDSDCSSYKPNKRGEQVVESDSESSQDICFMRKRRPQVLSDDEKVEDDGEDDTPESSEDEDFFNYDTEVDDDDLQTSSASENDLFDSGKEWKAAFTGSTSIRTRGNHVCDSKLSKEAGFIDNEVDDHEDCDDAKTDDVDFDLEDQSDTKNPGKENLGKQSCGSIVDHLRQVLRSQNRKKRYTDKTLEYLLNLYYHIKELSCLKNGCKFKQLFNQWNFKSVEDLGEDCEWRENCPCGQIGIRYLCRIYNEKTDNETYLGRICINKCRPCVKKVTMVALNLLRKGIKVTLMDKQNLEFRIHGNTNLEKHRDSFTECSSRSLPFQMPREANGGRPTLTATAADEVCSTDKLKVGKSYRIWLQLTLENDSNGKGLWKVELIRVKRPSSKREVPRDVQQFMRN